MITVLCVGKEWYKHAIIWTATSVLPVPGGPTTSVNPGERPDLTAFTCNGVKRIEFPNTSIFDGGAEGGGGDKGILRQTGGNSDKQGETATAGFY